MSHHVCHVRQTQTSSSAGCTILHHLVTRRRALDLLDSVCSLLLKRTQSVPLPSVLPSCFLLIYTSHNLLHVVWADVPCFFVVDDEAGLKFWRSWEWFTNFLMTKSPLSPFFAGFTKRRSNNNSHNNYNLGVLTQSKRTVSNSSVNGVLHQKNIFSLSKSIN